MIANKLPLFSIAAMLFFTGCATKSYVRKSIDPVNGKVDQVTAKTDTQGQTLDQTRQTLDQTRQTQEKDETQLNATNERAQSADSRATQALSSADQANQSAAQANQKADTVNGSLNNLKGVVANLDDYKQVSQTTVSFKFDSAVLSPDAKQALDQLATDQGRYKRFFVSVEGFTDKTGDASYNEALSRRRADAVVEYLVGQGNVPIYRIHMVGLGEMKPADEGKGREANAKNRRVEVTLFSADSNTPVASLQQ